MASHHGTAPRRVGILGAGRTRNGLGPFLARYCERHGLSVAAIAGRDAARAAEVAREFEREFGHPVAVCRDAMSLAGHGLDALVVASPPAAHLDGLRAALARRLPCLCEKPIVAAHQLQAGLASVDAFAERGLLLVENSQWPFVLPAFDALFPQARGPRPPALVQLGLSPSVVGPAMLPDSAPHLLSLVDALLPVAVDAQVAQVEQADASAGATRNLVALQLRWSTGELRAELHLQHCVEQPRPAWLAIDGCRMDRRIGADYAITFAADGREVPARDPLEALVADFAARVTRGSAEREVGVAAGADAARRVGRRLRWLGAVLAA